MKFPTLYAISSKGKIKQWSIEVDGSTIITEYGYQGGTLQVSKVKISQGKNLGRTNETTPEEQARLEAESKWKKQLDKKYTESPAGQSNILLPMLAHSYKKRKHHIKWPALVQPKFNGVRCLARKTKGGIEFTSRKGKPYLFLDHIAKDLDERMEVGEIFDGELYCEDLTFQEIVSAVKQTKTKSENMKHIKYYVYDMINKEPFLVRYNMYERILNCHLDSIVPVMCNYVEDETEVAYYHSQFVAEEYEGTIIRNRNGFYKQDFRSADLQKYKDFQDDEFEIVGAREGIGAAEGTVIWECITSCGPSGLKKFSVRPKGTVAQRRNWWENRKQYIHKRLTVQFQEYSDDGVPIFPVGLTIRDYE